MKCGASGYKHREWDEEQGKNVSDGTDEFVKINGHFTVESGGYFTYQDEVGLNACPQCNTVQLVRW